MQYNSVSVPRDTLFSELIYKSNLIFYFHIYLQSYVVLCSTLRCTEIENGKVSLIFSLFLSNVVNN